MVSQVTSAIFYEFHGCLCILFFLITYKLIYSAKECKVYFSLHELLCIKFLLQVYFTVTRPVMFGVRLNAFNVLRQQLEFELDMVHVTSLRSDVMNTWWSRVSDELGRELGNIWGTGFHPCTWALTGQVDHGQVSQDWIKETGRESYRERVSDVTEYKLVRWNINCRNYIFCWNDLLVRS
jgi:hypothetical protein